MTEPPPSTQPSEPTEPDQASIAWGIIVAGLVVVVYLLVNWLTTEAAKHTGQANDAWIKIFLNATTVVTGVVLLVVAILSGAATIADAWRYAWSRIRRR